MKYVLTFYCDECYERGQGFVQNGTGALVPPNGWGTRTLPSGEMVLACSKKCAREMDSRLGARRSVVVPSRSLLLPARN